MTNLLYPLPSRLSLLAWLCLLLALCTGIYSHKSYADIVINDEGAEKLQSAFQNTLDSYALTFNTPESKLVYDGDIAVEKANGYYAITTPHISLLSQTGEKLEIGIFAINAIPADGPGRWTISYSMPTPITFFDAEGELTSRIDIGSQQASGLWLEDINYFIKIDATYKDIKIENTSTDPSENFSITLPEILLQCNLKELSEGKWSGPYAYGLKKLQVKNNEGLDLSIDNIEVSGSIKEFDTKAYKEVLDEIEAFAENVSEEDIENMSTENAVAFGNTMIRGWKSYGSGMTSQATVQNVSFLAPKTEESADKPVNINIGSMGFGFDMINLQTDNGKLAFRMGFNAFNLKDVIETYNALTPEAMNLDLQVKNIPFVKLIDLGKKTLQSTMKDPATSNMAGLQAMMTAPVILTESETHLAIHDTHVGNDKYKITLEGKITPNAQAVKGITADILGKVRGLSFVKNALTKQTSSEETSDEEKQQAQQSLFMLGMVESLGKETTDDNNTPIRTFHLVVNEQGQMLLNGNDMSALLGAAMMGGNASAPPSVPSEEPTAETTE